MIETTYMMKISVIEDLYLAEEKTGVKSNKLILSAMRLLLKNHDIHMCGSGSIKYQERTAKGTKKRVHFRLGEMEYEFFNDMRKFFRKSISFLIAIAVNKHLPKIVDEILKKSIALKKNNYPKYKYTIFKKSIKNNVFWLIYWGLPPD